MRERLLEALGLVQRAQQVATEAVAKVQATAQDLIKKPGDDLVSGGGI